MNDLTSFKVQVLPSHYSFHSNPKDNLCPFYNLNHQVSDILYLVKEKKLTRPRILIIGVGDNLLSAILVSRYRWKIDTFDIDPRLNPTIVGSVSCLQQLTKRKYDIIVCAHVLEHLPFAFFEGTLRQISNICKYSLIYLPISQLTFYGYFGIDPFIHLKLKYHQTRFFIKHKFDGQHYWEIGKLNFPKRKIKNILKKYFIIMREYNSEYWRYSYNFVLKSR